MDYIFDSVGEFFNQPFSEDMDVLKWLAFTGMIVIFSLAWWRVIKTYVEE